MNSWLKGNMFGMPRWAWLSLLVAGVAAGLYLRHRNQQQQAAAATAGQDPNAIDPATGLPYGSETQTYDPALDPSLAGLGAYPQGSGSNGYENSYAMDLLSQLLGGSGASANTPDDVAAALQDFEAQQADYDAQLQDAINTNNKQLQKQIKAQKRALKKQINALKKKHKQHGGGKVKKHKSDAVMVGGHAGSGQRGRFAPSHPAQGRNHRHRNAHGRTRANTPTGGGRPARPPHAHMPVHKKKKKK